MRSKAGSGEVLGGSIASVSEGAGVTNWVYIVGNASVCVCMPVQFPACRLTNMWAPALTNPPILFLSVHTIHILFLPSNMQINYRGNMHTSVKNSTALMPKHLETDPEYELNFPET